MKRIALAAILAICVNGEALAGEEYVMLHCVLSNLSGVHGSQRSNSIDLSLPMNIKIRTDGVYIHLGPAWKPAKIKKIIPTLGTIPPTILYLY